jgi:hypothetical protein
MLKQRVVSLLLKSIPEVVKAIWDPTGSWMRWEFREN